MQLCVVVCLFSWLSFFFRKITDDIYKYETRLEKLKSELDGQNVKLDHFHKIFIDIQKLHDRNSETYQMLQDSGKCYNSIQKVMWFQITLKCFFFSIFRMWLSLHQQISSSNIFSDHFPCFIYISTIKKTKLISFLSLIIVPHFYSVNCQNTSI